MANALKPCHQRLAALVGEWEGTTKTWLDPAGEPDVSPSKARTRQILGGLFVLQEHESSIAGKPFTGFVIYGYDAPRDKFTTVWIDSFHMGSQIMLSEGDPDESSESISVLGQYTDPGSRQVWGWRSVASLPGHDHLKLEAFNIAPDGCEQKAIETLYTRRI